MSAEFIQKLETCEVCAATAAIYTCPKCEVRTCCLTCVNIHKKELDCDGIRDKTKFVPLKNFTDLDLLSDYRLLEEAGRSVDQLQRDKSKKYSRINNLPVHLLKLTDAASRRGIQLCHMPQNFSRHNENTSYLNWKTNELFWRIEWRFPQAEGIKWITARVLESKRLSDILESIIDPSNSISSHEPEEEVQRRKILHDKLQYYRAIGISGLKVFLKAEKVKNAGHRCYELDPTLSFQENLANKTIIEFPILYVVLKDHTDMYEVIDSDQEKEIEESQIKNIHRRKRGIRNKSNQSHNEKKETKSNFFFCSDSDDEIVRKKPSRKHENASHLEIPEFGELVKMEI